MAAPLPTSQQQYATWLAAQDKYKKQQTGGVGFLQALQSALAGADSQNTALRDQQKALVQQQFETPTKYREQLIGEGITDPYKRQALLDQKLGNVGANLTGIQGKLADLGGQRQQVLETSGKAYDSETQAALQEAQSAGDFFKTLLGQDQSREERAFQARQNDLNRANATRNAQISNSSKGGLTIKDLVANPLLALINAGVKRVADQSGGFSFFDKSGTPITVQQAAELAGTGASAADLLSGSTNKQDQQVSGKPATEAQTTTGLYASRIKQANDIFEGLNKYTSNLNSAQYFGQKALPGPLNALRSGDFQSLDQAERNFINAVLRRESGAVISPSEFENARKQYLPQPGDKASTLAQKKANRDLVQQQFIQGSGGSYSDPTTQNNAPTNNIQTMSDGSQWKQNADGSYTKIK